MLIVSAFRKPLFETDLEKKGHNTKKNHLFLWCHYVHSLLPSAWLSIHENTRER